ncbi:PhoX family protein [Flexivirga meconopsidis]|uniref:PhoX family protein n=1 Tax=Flexivirga meconopsidis TaxID=2977121 RepID=UPI00223EA436|nr:PhoX family phosphatase [Flexivirga meconopsidis]
MSARPDETSSVPVGNRRQLRLAPHNGSRDPMTCQYRCANACFHPVPNESDNEYFGDLVARAGHSRRTVLRAVGVGAIAASAVGVQAGQPAAAKTKTPKTKPNSAYVWDFEATPPVPFATDKVVTPEGFTWEPLVKWGDPIVKGAPRFDFDRQTAAAQEQQFGYNCDYVGLIRTGKNSGLLVVNNEYTNDELMFRGYTSASALTTEQVKIVMAAHGMSVVEVRKTGDTWRAKLGAKVNRRITATTPIELTGPAAGSKLTRTNADPTGRRVLGTFANCSGGMTPWGTVLSGEENFNGYFRAPEAPADQKAAYDRYGVTGSEGRNWESVDPRFDATREPNEVNRFGYVVEVDPADPSSTPRKHTALGRVKHEGATTRLSADGRAVVYLGDDERFDYLYKFVSRDRYKPGDKKHNLTLLEAGDLYVAKFAGGSATDHDGTGTWVPLTKDGKSAVAGMSVEEVLVHTRLAADQVGATKMDRPEDVEPSPVTGKVYMVCTNNSKRTAAQVDGPNPRPSNKHGHIIEISEAAGDAAATTMTWRLVLIAGDPNDPSTYFDGYDRAEVSPISCPDNVAFDSRGNLWISTDGNALGNADAFFMMPLEGAEFGHVQQFHTMPHGAEAAGPLIVDDTTVLCSVQHPGEVSGATPASPASQFPYDGTGQPRPTVIQVYADKQRTRK